MNFSLTVLVAVAIVLQIIGSNQSNADDTDINIVLQNGFEGLNNTMAMAEGLIQDGLNEALGLVDTNTTGAQEAILNSIKDAQTVLFTSGPPLFFASGKATSNCSNARESILQIAKTDSMLALKILNAMRTGITLTMQGLNVGGDAAKLVINGIRSNFEAKFGALYKQVPISLQEAMQAVADCSGSMPTDNESIGNSGPASNNNDTQNAISELNEAAANAIQNGANAFLVIKLRDLLISSILDLQQIATYGRNGFLNFTNSVKTDPSAAMKSFSDVLEIVNDTELRIFIDVCLDIGVVADNENLSQEQLQNSYIAVELGIDEIWYVNSLVKKIAFESVEYEGDVLQDAYDAVTSIGRSGKIDFMKRIVEAGKDEFNIL